MRAMIDLSRLLAFMLTQNDISSTVTDLSRILEAEMSPADNWSQIFLPKFSWR